ncbi:MAG: transposase [Deltaproteobacteria bacterium]|nr:transposase [Deltaproteobacteria bacterium]
MARHPRSFWASRVAELDAGESVDDVARRHRVKATTLRWWRSALRREPAEVPAFLPVVVRRAPLPAVAEPLELVVGDAVLRVPVGADVGYVAALLRAVGRPC